MNEYINTDNWVDLSNLPRIHGKSIHWEKSVGEVIKFRYQGIDGELIIIKHRPKQHGVRVFVQNYTNLDGYDLETYALTHCKLGGLLRKNILLHSSDSVKYLVNDDDKFLPYSSQKKIDVKCPICGLKKQMRVTELTHYGFSCNRCGDGVSYPNKFMFNLLDQIHAIYDFEISKTKPGYDWLQNYRYDFLIHVNNNDYFIEMDGSFHFKNRMNKDGAKKQRQTDMEKDFLANEHHIPVIRINCDYYNIRDRYSFIKDNILSSDLSDILNLENQNIDWDSCNKAGCTSLCAQACDYWNSGIRCAQDISNIINISPATVVRYLKNGAQFGFCNYDPKQVVAELASKRSRPIAVFNKDGKLLYVFRSCSDLVNKSNLFFGRQFYKSTVFACCSKKKKYAYGYVMDYITIDEYHEYLRLYPDMFYNTKLIQKGRE